MKKFEFDMIMDMLNDIQNEENERAARHCELNKDCKEEVRFRTRQQEAFNSGITHVRWYFRKVFQDTLED